VMRETRTRRERAIIYEIDYKTKEQLLRTIIIPLTYK